MTSFNLNVPLRALPPNTFTFGVRASRHEFGRGTRFSPWQLVSAYESKCYIVFTSQSMRDSMEQEQGTVGRSI